MNRKDRNWLLNRLDVAAERASRTRQFVAAFHDELVRLKTFKIAKGETMDPAEIERFAVTFKEYAGEMLRSLGSLQCAAEHCFPKEDEEKEKRPA